jgi:predicted nuclease of predicted toxin-antitoxin system
MKLLIDENLSPKLVAQLADIFPECAHVRDLGLARASDPSVWQYALQHGFTIVSKDEDFHHLSFLRGSPPKVIGINTGNCSTRLVLQLLRGRISEIEQFGADPTASFLPLP